MRQRYAYSIIFPQKKGRKLFPGGKMETGRQQNGNGCRPVSIFPPGKSFLPLFCGNLIEYAYLCRINIFSIDLWHNYFQLICPIKWQI